VILPTGIVIKLMWHINNFNVVSSDTEFHNGFFQQV